MIGQKVSGQGIFSHEDGARCLYGIIRVLQQWLNRYSDGILKPVEKRLEPIFSYDSIVIQEAGVFTRSEIGPVI